MPEQKFSLRLVSGPTIEPVTVAEVKTYAHIDHTTEDALIGQWIKSARILAEGYQRRAYMRQTWEVIYDCFPAMPLYIPRPPLVEVKSVKYYDYQDTETELTLATYFQIDTNHEPGRIAFKYGQTWPTATLRDLEVLKIQYVAGYNIAGSTSTTEDPDASDVPANVKDAIYLYCTYRSENRTAEGGSVPDQFYNLLSDERIYL